MKNFRKRKITRSLIFSFCLLIIIVLVLGLLTLNGVRNVSKLTRTIYDHPLAVSNAALQSNVLITKMHRNMKDIVLFNAPERIQTSIEAVNLQEQMVYKNLDIVKFRILGQEGRRLEMEARRLFDDWRPIRQEVIRLVKQQEVDKAAEVTIGKGAEHVNKLEQKMLGLTNYARNKASSFMAEVESEHLKVNTIVILFIIAILAALLLIGFVTLKRTAISERELRESRQLLMNAIDFSPIGMVLLDPHGKFYRVNQAFCKTLGYSQQELATMSYQDIIEPEDRDLGPKIIEKMLQGKLNRTNFEKRYLKKDGRKIDVLLTTTLLKNDDGTPLFFFIQIQDITERKAAERRERETMARLRLAMESANEGVWEWDYEKNQISFDEMSLRMLGYGSGMQPMPGQWWINQIHPIDRSVVEKIYSDFVTGNISKCMVEFRIKCFNGSYIWVLSTAKIIRKDNHGQPLLVIGIYRNITERKQSEKALQENEERYRVLFKSSSDAVILVDVDTIKIIDANEKAVELYGYKLEEILKMKAFELSAEPEKTKQMISVKMDTVIPLRYHRKKDGTVFPVQITANYFTLNDRKINISAIRDISEIKKFERRLNQAQKMESIGTLAGGIAHDFNNILSSIIGFTELSLDDVKKGSMIEDNLQEVYSAAKRAKELVKQILTFARQSEEDVKPIQVNTIAQEVFKLIRSSIPTTIAIEQKINSDSLIIGNPTQIHQILMNLCTNAAHAMEEEGGILSISINDIIINKSSAQRHQNLDIGEYVEIKVSDTGAGIPPDIVESVFEPYFTTKSTSKGTGLGLSVVHGIIKSYGGVINVHSKQGEGSVFILYLPITKKQITDSSYLAQKLPGGKEHILFVDDEPSIARMGAKMLELLGYTVTTRTNSFEALEAFRAKPHHFDLVITDMTMPNMTGDKLAMEAMALRPGIPVILCTGYSKKISKEDAKEAGIKAFAYKPIIQAELAKTVRKVLDETKSDKPNA